MKALVIDSASSCLVISARNESQTISVSLDMGLSQSQKILTAIDFCLSQVKIPQNELDFIALTKGPGTFTGLRLAFAAAKALELSSGIPVYGIDSLEAYGWAYRSFDGLVVSVIDAKKDQFFARITDGNTVLMDSKDTTVEEVLSFLDGTKPVLTAGPDSAIFADILRERAEKDIKDLRVISFSSQPTASEALFSIGQYLFENKKPALEEYEGPAYLRKSEAELSLEKDKTN